MSNSFEVSRPLPGAHFGGTLRLADAALWCVVAWHHRWLVETHGEPVGTDTGTGQELMVVGRGKLGGLELNYSSDVDVIYVYSSDQGEAGTLSLHEYFAKLSTLITSALSEVTEDDLERLYAHAVHAATDAYLDNLRGAACDESLVYLLNGLLASLRRARRSSTPRPCPSRRQ